MYSATCSYGPLGIRQLPSSLAKSHRLAQQTRFQMMLVRFLLHAWLMASDPIIRRPPTHGDVFTSLRNFHRLTQFCGPRQASPLTQYLLRMTADSLQCTHRFFRNLSNEGGWAAICGLVPGRQMSCFVQARLPLAQNAWPCTLSDACPAANPIACMFLLPCFRWATPLSK